MLSSRYRAPKRAFTLIELLVVIAIIAILAAILFPVFAQARAKARQAVCMSNQKQMVTGAIMYNQDYDDRWIDRCAGYNLNSDYFAVNINADIGYCYDNKLPSWMKQKTKPSPWDDNYLLKPYLKNTDVMYCPNIHKGKDVTGAISYIPDFAANELWCDIAGSPAYPSSGGFYQQYLPPDLSSKVRNAGKWRFVGAFGRLNAQLAQPAGLIVMWEHNNPAEECNNWSAAVPGHWDASHQGGFNAGFADGHVKRYSLGQMTNQLVCYWDLPK